MFTKHGSTRLHNKSPRHPSYWQIGNTGSGYLQHHARDLLRQPTFTLPPGSMTSKGPSLSEHTSELRQLKIIIKCKSSTCDMFETKWLHNYKQYSGYYIQSQVIHFIPQGTMPLLPLGPCLTFYDATKKPLLPSRHFPAQFTVISHCCTPFCTSLLTHC